MTLVLPACASAAKAGSLARACSRPSEVGDAIGVSIQYSLYSLLKSHDEVKTAWTTSRIPFCTVHTSMFSRQLFHKPEQASATFAGSVAVECRLPLFAIA